MPLVSSRDLLIAAQRGGYAVGAFNVENMEMVQAVISAAQDMNAPVLLQTTSSTLKYAHPQTYCAMASAFASRASVPVAMHLDHTSSLDLAKEALDAGYTSIMIDGSALDFADNIALSKAAVHMAQGVPVEAELGTVGGKEDDTIAEGIALTDPTKAAEFVKATGISSLAVAIGTAHGVYQGQPRLDFERLAAIREQVQLPLVLHGASGISEEQIKCCIALGICKVNIATELRIAYTQAVREILSGDPEIFDPKAYGKAGRSAVYELVCDSITMLGSQGKADAHLKL